MSNDKPKRKRRTKAQIEADKLKQGLGDKVEKVSEWIGAKAFAKYLNGGEECEGCAKRKLWLNKTFTKAQPLNEEDVIFIESVKGKTTLKATEVMDVHKRHARIYNYKYIVPGNCSSCTKIKLSDLVKLYDAYNQ